MRDFLIVGPQNACTYKNVFPYLKDGSVGIGENHVNCLEQPDGTVKKFVNIRWYTNIGHGWSGKPLELTRTYNPEEYPKYDNYDAIEVSKVKDIPVDYNGVMGVPITFLYKYCPTQFEIVKFRKGNDDKDLSVNGKCPYFRILIKRVSNK